MRIGTLALACLFVAGVGAAPQEASKEELRKAIKDTEVQGAWVYDDIPAGFAEAKKTGKPMLVVFR